MSLSQEEKGKALVWASRRGLLEEVRRLLQTGPNDVALRQVDEWNFTPAHLAAFYDQLEVLQALVEAGADVAARAKAGVTPLHCSAMQGHCQITELLLANGAEPSWRDDHGRPAAHSAASDNHCDVLQVLAAGGDGLEGVDKNGNSILHAAASGGAHEAFEMLVLTRGGAIPWRNYAGWTPLHKAVVEASYDTVKLVLQVAADHQFQDERFDIDCATSNDGASPLILAARRGSLSVVELLLDYGANIHATDQWRSSALHSAVAAGHTDIVRTLIRRGADVHAKHTGGDGSVDGEYGMDAVLDAVHFGHAGALEALLEGGACISDAVTAEGYSALHIAAYKGNLALLRLLLNMKLPHGVDSPSFDGSTPLIIATGAGRMDSVGMLLDHGADVSIADYAGWTPLHWAVNRNRLRIVMLLLDCGADPTVESYDGDTALSICPLSLEGKDLEEMEELLLTAEHEWSERDTSLDCLRQLLSAARSGNLDLITSALEAGNVAINSADEDGHTGLLLAAEMGHDSSVRLLIEKGAEVDVRNTAGETALWLAAHYGHGLVVQTLLDSGADPNSADELGQTAISAAAEGGFLQAVECLLAKDANIHTKTIYGKNAMMFAAHGGHDGVMQALLKRQADSEGVFNLSNLSEAITLQDEVDHSKKTTIEVKSGMGAETSRSTAIQWTSKGVTLEALNDTKSLDVTRSVADAPEPNSRGAEPVKFGSELVELAEKGMRAGVERLIKAGHLTETMDRRGYLPLCTAAVNGHVSMVRTLLHHGTDPDLRDGLGRTAIWWAAYNGWHAVVKVLMDASAHTNYTDHVLQLSPLMAATYRGHVKVLKALLEAGDMELTEKYGYSALGIAVRFRQVDVVRLLVESGADVEHGPEPSRTPLMTAVGQGDTKIVELLLQAGTEMRVSMDNRSLLCIAAQYGFEEIVMLLLQHGAEVDHLTSHGLTPLFYAAANGYEMVVRILIMTGGARVDHRDENNLTALSWAKMQGHESLASILRHPSRFKSNSKAAAAVSVLSRRGHYSYLPLSKPTCIRLIDLHPGHESDALSFDLYEVDMDYEPFYEALSYEWKAKKGTIPVLCCDRSLLITPNLKLALQRIRSRQKVRTLWVDAICINQEDVEERTSQVRLMTKIYKQAAEVLMWLGEGSPKVEAAFTSIPAVLETWGKLPAEGFFTYSLSSDVSKVLEALHLCKRVFGKAGGEETHDREAASGATDLLGRSYFTRAWIYQELVLGGARGSVLCGENCIQWKDFHQFMAMWAVWKGGEQARERDIMMLIAKASEMVVQGGIKDMGSAIQILTHLDCGDPRDKVFAVLGVVDSNWSGELAPDYSLSVQQVYINAARVMMRTTEGLGFWQGINYPKANNVPGLPSWVPDWTCISARYKELEGGEVLPCLFRQPIGRAIPSLLNSQFQSTETTLYGNGYILGEIAFSVTMKAGEDIYDSIVRPLITGLESLDLNIFNPCPYPESLSYFSMLYRFLMNSLESEQIADDKGCSWGAEFLAWKISADFSLPERSRTVPVEMEHAVRNVENRFREDKTIFEQDVHRICNGLERCLKERLRERNNTSANAPQRMTLPACDLFCTRDGHLGVSGEGTAESGLVLTLLEGFMSVAMMRQKSLGGEDEIYSYVDAADILEMDWKSYRSVNDIPINGEMNRLKIV